MANKKVNPSEDFYDFLPKEVQESTKIKTISEKNVLATLCYQYLSHSIYAKANEGWFYCSLDDIKEGCGIERSQLKKIMLKLILQKLIERKSGTKHHCTHYRLHPKIVELLPTVEGDYSDNEPLMENNEPLTTVEIPNEPLVSKSANEPLDKIRLDKSSKDLDSLIVEEDMCVAPLDEDATTHKDWDAIIEEWKTSIKQAKTFEELLLTKKTFITNITGIPTDFKDKIERVRDSYEWRYAILRNKH